MSRLSKGCWRLCQITSCNLFFSKWFCDCMILSFPQNSLLLDNSDDCYAIFHSKTCNMYRNYRRVKTSKSKIFNIEVPVRYSYTLYQLHLVLIYEQKIRTTSGIKYTFYSKWQCLMEHRLFLSTENSYFLRHEHSGRTVQHTIHPDIHGGGMISQSLITWDASPWLSAILVRRVQSSPGWPWHGHTP